MDTRAVVALCSVFIFCCYKVYVLEVLIRKDPGVGNLITFFQFAFLSVNGLVFTSKFGTVKLHIPLKKYAILVVLFFLSSVANNYAFNFNIPMPLHMVFRSGSLMANMALGIIILNNRYNIWKYAVVGMVTVGIIVFTVQSGAQVKEKSQNSTLTGAQVKEKSQNSTLTGAQVKEKSQNSTLTGAQVKEKSQNSTLTEAEKEAAKSEDLFWWFVGIFLLTFVLFMTARMGLFQETLYQKYGKHAWEALFYTHILPLPLFAFIYPILWNHWVISGQSEPMFGDAMSTTRFYLLIITLSQCLCVGCVYFLTTECTSLTVTLTVTLRHWSGTLLIFIGTLIYTELLQNFIAFIWRAKRSATSEAIEVTSRLNAELPLERRQLILTAD